MENITQPKVFISYSWSSLEYQERVTRIVNMLRDNGIDTVYDKYDLEQGASVHKFMEKIVNDPTITKVLIFCDKQYAEKANAGTGGAGIETLIISPKVYGDADPSGKNKKFIPIVMEKDENGNAYLPTYLEGRFYSDFSKSEAENYEEFIKLVRLLYGKPEFVAPELGKTPSFISSEKPVYAVSDFKKNVAINALKRNLPNAIVLCEDFFEQTYDILNKFALDCNDEENMDDKIWNYIEELLPLRNDCLDVIETMIQCSKQEESVNSIHKFFEKLLTYQNAAKGNAFVKYQSDHFRFFAYETFMNFSSFLVEHGYFKELKILMDDYYYKSRTGSASLKNFTVFDTTMESFSIRNRRLQLNRKSLKADLLKSRWRGRSEDFEKIMQTDLLLFLCALNIQKNNKSDMYTWWYPSSLIYADIRESSFEIFLRATKREFFNRTLGQLGLTPEGLRNMETDLTKLLASYNRFGWIEPRTLANLDKLATKD